MKLSFKQFNSFVDLPEDASQEQLTEIFGKFFGKDEVPAAVKAQREKLQKMKGAKEKQISKTKDEIWARAAAKAAGKPLPSDDEEKGSGTARAKQARERSADIQWAG